MVLIALKCPSCNGDIQLDDNNEFGFCMYCGCRVVLQEKIKQQISIDESSKVKSLLSTAEDYYKQGYEEETCEYARRVVDMDSSNIRGWYLVVKTTSKLSEKKVACNKVIESTDDGPEVEECRREYELIRNKVTIRVIGDFEKVNCVLYIDKDSGHRISPGSEVEIAVEKGVHKFKLNMMAANNLFGMKREITKDCKLCVRESSFTGALILDFE